MPERQTILTTCTRDCPDACGIVAHVTSGKLVGLTGAKEHEITRSFLCRKAINFIRRVYSPERVLKPRRKVNGVWQDLEWDEALTLIAEETKKNIERYGSLSILHYQGAGSLGALKMLQKRFFNLLGGVTEAVGSLCGGAGIAGQTQDFGYRTCHDPLDLLNSRLIIIWGRNPSETNMHLIPILKSAQANGTKIILIDPVNTDTSSFCNIHIKPNPGMDGYLALGLAKVILEVGNVDMDFINNCAEDFDGYLALVNSFDLKLLSALSGVSVENIQQLADLYSKTKPAAIICGWGLQRYEWGAETFRLIDALGAITGNIGVSGGGVNHGRDESGYFNESVKGKEFAKHKREIPKPLLGEAIKMLDDPPIKMAFINGANPLNQSPDIKSVIEAFEKIDFVVVFEQFMTDTAERADVVLPVTTFLEETNIVGSYWHSFVGLVNPAIEPVGEVRTDLEIYQGLAELLGIGHEMAGTAEDWIRKIIRPLNRSGITLEALKKKPHIRIAEIPAVAFKDRVFKTPSGKFKFITEFSAPRFTTDDYPLVLLSTHSRLWLHSQLMPEDHAHTPVARVSPITAKQFGIGDGEDANIVSPVGSVKVVVKYDEGIKENVIRTEQGRWYKYNQSMNHLVPAIMSRKGQNACYYQTAVRLEKGQPSKER
ncbi:MAG: molybdopterin-dependent oxidoreductase [Actinomycetota bacterium]